MGPQLGFFSGDKITLTGGVAYYPGFIDCEEGDKLFAALMKLEWNQHIYIGRQPAPRKYAWMGIPYSSPNLANEIVVTEWTPEARHIKALVEEKTGCSFDSLNLNLYENHRDSIDWHSDGKEEGLWTFPIASVSLGESRSFKWRRNKKNSSITTQTLEHGSMLVMPPGFQRDYLHALLKRDKE